MKNPLRKPPAIFSLTVVPGQKTSTGFLRGAYAPSSAHIKHCSPDGSWTFMATAVPTECRLAAESTAGESTGAHKHASTNQQWLLSLGAETFKFARQSDAEAAFKQATNALSGVGDKGWFVAKNWWVLVLLLGLYLFFGGSPKQTQGAGDYPQTGSATFPMLPPSGLEQLKLPAAEQSVVGLLDGSVPKLGANAPDNSIFDPKSPLFTKCPAPGGK